MPETSKPLSDEPVTLTSLEALASRSGRLASNALRVVTARSTGKPCAGSSRTVPVADTSPLRAVWKLSFCSCSVSPCSARLAWPPLSRRPLSGRESAAPLSVIVPVPVTVLLTVSVTSVRSVPVTPRRLLPRAGENGAISMAPFSATVAASGAAPRGIVALPLTPRLVAPPAVSLASNVACCPTTDAEPCRASAGRRAVSGRLIRKPLAA